MAYDLMLLADPGPPRARVLQALRESPVVRPDAALENRFWVRAGAGELQVNIGSKDPIESVHCELTALDLEHRQAAARWALELARELEMRLEDVQWGHEVTERNLEELVRHWQQDARPGAREGRKPWWRVW